MRASRRRWLVPLGIILFGCFPLVERSQYILQVTDSALIYAIAVLGLGILLGFAGQMSLAQAAFFGIGAYASGLLSVQAHWPVWGAMAAAVVITAVCGYAIGWPCLRLSGHYLALATIGFGIIVQLILINDKGLTNGPDGLTGIPAPSLGGLSLDSYQAYFYVVYITLLIAMYIAVRLKHSRVGRALEAIRENEIAASAMGIDTTKFKVLAFVLSSAYGGLAGALIAHMTKFISPDSYSFDQSVVFLVMLVIGGATTMSGAVVGAILLTFLPEVLRPLKSSYIMVYGAAVIAMVIFFPTGLVGVAGHLTRRFRRAPEPPPLPSGAPPAPAPAQPSVLS